MFKHNIRVVDRTTQQRAIPQRVNIDENILIVSSFPQGVANTLRQYYPGESKTFIDDFGPLNYNRYGVASYIAYDALDNDRNMGVLAINIQPDDATLANVALVAKTKVNKNVQVTNDTGTPLYKTPKGEIVTEALGNTPYTRDVLNIKMEAQNISAIKNEAGLQMALDALRSDEDNGGSDYKTFPLVAFYYEGVGNFGNEMHLRIIPRPSTINDDFVYDIDVFNGTNNEVIDGVSFHPMAESYPGRSIFIGMEMATRSSRVFALASKTIDDFFDLVKQYNENPTQLNLFEPSAFQVAKDSTSIDPTQIKAFPLANGTPGTTSKIPERIKAFFEGKIVDDIDNITRWKIDIVPDLEYTLDIKQAIVGFCSRRSRTTNAILMVGDSTFESSITEKINSFSTDSDTVMLMAKCQKPVKYDIHSKRDVRMPAIYYTMERYVQQYRIAGHSFNPLAGASARWEGFYEESLKNPPYGSRIEMELEDNRINYVRMDNAPGAYIASQNTNVSKISDRMEFNNMRVVSQIVHAVNQVAHRGGYTFNETEDLYRFNDEVRAKCQVPFAPFVSNIATEVYKDAYIGAGKNTNYINIMINFKDLSKVTNTQIIITDEKF